jgi:hypothetical protein
MRAPPDKNKAGVGAPAEMRLHVGPEIITKRHERKQASLEIIGEISRGHSSQLRVAVSQWRGERKIEIRECTRLFDQTFFPVGKPLTLDIDRVPQLIAILSKAVAS